MKLPPPINPWQQAALELASQAPDYAAVGAAMAKAPKGDLLLKYQADTVEELFAGVSLFAIEKSRRIGLTWALAAYAVLRAGAAEGGMNVWYMGYDQEMAREFIDYCVMWARAFNVAAEAADEELIDIGDKEKAQAFRLRLSSGYKIVGLPSVARALRGKQGIVIVDEAAFHKDLAEVLKAALALLMWGGQVLVVSTHDGVDNPFNKLLNEIRAGERKGKTKTITFDEAITDGLFERIKLTNRHRGMTKDEWIGDVRDTYGDNAKEELDCIPSRGSGAWLTFDEIDRAAILDADRVVMRLTLEDGFSAQPDHLRTAFIQEWCETRLGPILTTFGARDAFGIGDDFARTSDLSVKWLLREREDLSWETALVVEMRNVPYTEQEFVAKWLLRRLRRWRTVVDANGKGEYLAERLTQEFGEGRVESLLAREPWWRENGPPVKQRFEDGRIAIPRDQDIAGDLRAVKVEGGVPAIPKTRTNAKGEDGSAQRRAQKRHADAAVALVQAAYALRTGVGAPIEFMSAGRTGVADEEDQGHGYGDAGSAIQLRGY